MDRLYRTSTRIHGNHLATQRTRGSVGICATISSVRRIGHFTHMHTCVLTSHAGMTTSPSSTDSFFEIQVTYRDGFPGRLPGKSEYLDRLNRDYFKESSRRSRSKNMIQVVLWFRIDLTRGKAAQLVTLRPNLVRDQIEVERWDIDATETV